MAEPDQQPHLKSAEEKRHMLIEFIDAALPLDDVQQAEFERRLQTEQYAAARQANLTTKERGQIEFILRCLERKFGQLPPSTEGRIRALSEESRITLCLRLGTATSFRELGLEPDPAE